MYVMCISNVCDIPWASFNDIKNRIFIIDAIQRNRLSIISFQSINANVNDEIIMTDLKIEKKKKEIERNKDERYKPVANIVSEFHRWTCSSQLRVHRSSKSSRRSGRRPC